MPPENHSRLIAKLMRELLQTEVFDTLADLSDATKVRCARLRIRWSTDEVTHAMKVIASNRVLTGALPPVQRRPTPPPGPTGRPLSRVEATHLYNDLMGRYQRERATVTTTDAHDFPALVEIKW